jgi:hypothetical protein
MHQQADLLQHQHQQKQRWGAGEHDWQARRRDSSGESMRSIVDT